MYRQARSGDPAQGDSSGSPPQSETAPSDPCDRKSLPNLGRDEFSISTLRFSSLGLHGRDSEASQLREAYERVQSSRRRLPRRLQNNYTSFRDLNETTAITQPPPLQGHSSSELALVSGRSGTGKTALAAQLKVFVKRSGGFFVSGKIDQHRRAEPLQAFVSCFTTLCDDILSLADVVRYHQLSMDIRAAICEAVGSEGVVLAAIFPKLKQIIGEQPEAELAADGISAQNRFNFVFRRFLRAICSYKPVVFHLDDLQWADEATLELMENLVTDRQNAGLLVVGCYRDNEVDEKTHPLAACIRKIERRTGNGVATITRVNVGNLGVDTVNELIAELLSMAMPETRELARIVHKKTDGNIFFVVHFLKSLKEEGMLRYKLGLLRWNWDEDEIRSNMRVTDNVVDLLQGKLRKLSQDVIGVLQMAACLGSRFDITLMILVAVNVPWGQIDSERTTDDASDERDNSTAHSVNECLDKCFDVGLLDRDAVSYWFVHDQIQQAVYALISKDKRGLLQLLIGQVIVECSAPLALEKALFVAVDLMNCGIDQISNKGDKRTELARLNLRAGKKALGSAACAPAARYLQTGISLLGPNHWEDHYSLSLDLFSSSAEAEFCKGNFDQMAQHLNPILTRTDIPIYHKVRSYSTLFDSLIAQDKMLEVIDVALPVLARMGVKLPTRNLKYAIMKELFKTKRLLRGRSVGALCDLPLMKDEKNINALLILDKLISCTYMAKPVLVPLIIFKMMQWSLTNGACKYTPIAFSMYGLILIGMRDLKGGIEFGKAALKLSEKLKAKDTESRTLYIVYASVAHWGSPAQLGLTPLKRGYQLGLEAGNIESAFVNIHFYCLLSLHSGRPLSSVEADLRDYGQQMKDCNQMMPYHLLMPKLQFVLNMRGNTENPVILQGEAAAENAYLNNYRKGIQLWLACFFEDYKLAWKMVEETRETQEPASLTLWRSTFFEGLTAFALARQTKSRMWRKRATKVLRKVQGWAKGGNMNCVHIVHLYQAERAALQGKTDEARAEYDKAISTASRNGFLGDKAIANERAGEFFYESGDLYWAAHYLGMALQWHVDWGAMAKADHIYKKHSSLLGEVKYVPTKERIPIRRSR